MECHDHTTNVLSFPTNRSCETDQTDSNATWQTRRNPAKSETGIASSLQQGDHTFHQWLSGNNTLREAFIVKSRCVEIVIGWMIDISNTPNLSR